MEYDKNDLLRFAQSPAGQQLLRYLQQNSGTQLQSAAALAANGSWEQAKSILSTLLSAPEIQAILKQLEDPQ